MDAEFDNSKAIQCPSHDATKDCPCVVVVVVAAECGEVAANRQKPEGDALNFRSRKAARPLGSFKNVAGDKAASRFHATAIFPTLGNEWTALETGGNVLTNRSHSRFFRPLIARKPCTSKDWSG